MAGQSAAFPVGAINGDSSKEYKRLAEGALAGGVCPSRL